MKITNLLIFGGIATACSTQVEDIKKPNIIYILADDLGYGDLGVYGQKIIQTPNIDQMAAEGMLFTQHYSGATVCAPSRSSLMTGLHTGHTHIRGNFELQPEGQAPLPAEAYTIAEMMKEAGYVTGAFGKWGLGMAYTEGDPNAQGFDEFFGFLCQRVAHRYYPTYLWHNGRQVALHGNDWTNKVIYAQDVIQERTLDFIRENSNKPFFLYVPHLIPHAELISPDDSFLHMYDGKFPEASWGFDSPKSVYGGNDYGAPDFAMEGYAPVENPRAVFAAMVSRLDHHLGEILELVKELGIDENTLVIFTSDNGPHTEGGADPEFFGSRGPFRGYKRDLYEAGIRVPHIARWPGKIEAGSTTSHLSAFWDVMPTLAEITGSTIPENTDGVSFLPTLLNTGNQKKHDYLYWEFHELGGRKALRKGDWKLVQYNVLHPERTTTELYNLKDDISETRNLASEFPELVTELIGIMNNARVHSEMFSFQTEFVLDE